ncbi:MAG: hypothetical protein OHK0029_18690 [Armatimonadaceae bacterium]
MGNQGIQQAAKWAARSLAALAVTVVGITGAGAQLPPEPAKPVPTDQQSLVNPYPKDKGNQQNRGRGSADLYWGVTDGNRSYRRPAYSRVPDINVNLANPGLLELDGWGFPRGAYQGGVFRLSPTVDVPAIGAGVGSAGNWATANGPSFPQFEGATGYFRAQALPRPNTSPLAYPLERRFTWDLRTLTIPNTIPGQQVRFQVRVLIPDLPDVQSDPPELRVSDARYIVYYYLRTPSGIFPKRKVFTLSQLNGGEEALLNANGLPAFFPLFTTATDINALPAQPDLGIPFQGVMLDDTTGNQGNSLFVLADGLRLVQSVDIITGTPTVTAPHGGRRAADAAPSVTGNQNFPAGVQPEQPRPGPQKQDPTLAAPDTSIINPVPVTEADFINIPGDPRYIPGNPQFDASQAFQSWNISTLFRGPESLIDPRRLDPTAVAPPQYPYPPAPVDLPGQRVYPGTPNRPQIPALDPVTGFPIINPNTNTAVQRTATSVDANNHNIYRFDQRTQYSRTNNPAVPYFSHMQVIYPKTEYVLDPEVGVPDADKDGTLSTPVGSVWCLDWLTGAPIWRFPDQTYAPGNARNPYLTTSGGTSFNANAGNLLRDPVTGDPVTQVPGIAVADKNLDGVIQDDEVYIVGQGQNPGGGVFASVTYSPRVQVRGQVQIPTYTINTATNESVLNVAPGSTVPAAPGRYFTAPNPINPNIGFRPVEVGMAFIAASNGVLYAVDAYGNNDNDYFPNQQDYRVFGRYRPGTTNVLWSFSRAPVVRGEGDIVQADPGPVGPNETLAQYYQRIKTKIPPTGSFDRAAPVVAYRRDEQDFNTGTNPFNPQTDELRLFAGNANGVMYAMDASADAGIAGTTTAVTGVQPLPFRKETYRPVTGILPGGGQALGANGIKWWFHTRGSIVSTPAISLMRQNAGGNVSSANPTVRRGVYFTSTEGRVYCVDWEGPVRKSDHVQALNYDLGFNATTSGPQVVAATAEALNDNYLFHNIFPANATARADLLEGTVRPRWTFPNLYRDIDNNDNRLDEPADVAANNPDRNVTNVAGVRLAEPETTLGPITTSPVLVDFPWTDPLIPNAPTRHISYVVIQANDAAQNGLPATQSRVYLLDQVGDRVNFLSNTVRRGTGTAARVFAHPKDRFSPRTLLGEAAPAWTFRLVYDWYDARTNPDTDDRVVNWRNRPVLQPGSIEPPLDQTQFQTGTNRGLPGRKIVPTLFVGGIGRLFALDFDPETALFMRWRPTLAETRDVVALPDWNLLNDGTLFPGREADADRLFPVDPILDSTVTANPADRTELADRRLLVRTVALGGTPTALNSLTISGGPLQNRNTVVEYLPPSGSSAGVPPAPTVPPLPTNDAPNLRPNFIDPTQQATRFDESGLRVNQDINDPLSTTEGVRGSNISNPANSAANRIPNTAFQYPMIFVTDENNLLHAVSSNIEGEDYNTDFTTIGESTTVGWGIWEVSPNRFTPDHSLHFIVEGAGGPAGVAVVTNAYFPATSPNFLNSLRATQSPFDPFRFYPFGEPNTTGAPFTTPTPWRSAAGTDDPVPPPAPNNDDPRPDFRPRSFSLGTPAGAGPDGISGTPDDVLPTAGDIHTGQSGFPLDLNGLFFDKRFAGQRNTGFLAPNSINNGLYDIADPTDPQPGGGTGLELRSIPGQHPNGNFDVRLRLPGYSYIGGVINEADENNQVPDGARTDIPLGNTEADDINPAATNVTWIFAGGLDGVLKAYTPAAAGQSSGFAAGIQTGRGDATSGRGGNPQVAIVDEATFNQVVADAADGVLSNSTPAILNQNSIARRGGRNFYEYGETAYIIVYDLLAQTNTAGDPLFVPEEDQFITLQDRVTIQIRSLNNNAPVATARLRLEGAPNSDRPAYYFQQAGNPLFDQNPTSPFFAGANATPFGIVAYRFEIENPSPQKPLVPGDVIQVSVVQTERTPVTRGGQRIQTVTNPAGAGGNTVIQSLTGNADSFLAIANPIAVQGFLLQTAPDVPGGPLLPVGAQKANVADTQNGIGPFQAESNQLGGTKTEVADVAGTLSPGPTDPDKAIYDYSQALTNGNIVQRRDLRVFLPGASATAIPVPNPRYNQVLQEGAGTDRTNEQPFYFPVIASAGYINHGEIGTTDAVRQNLRVLNRSLLPTLGEIRIAPIDEAMLWRSWPGRIPNAEANQYNAAGAVIEDNNNPRLTPAGMDPNGRINRLPWETGINENRPWNPTALPNASPDYPDISARQEDALVVTGGSGNYTNSVGSLPAIINGTGNAAVNNSIQGAGQPAVPVNGRFAVSAKITVPKHQPANLVALHNLTSTYQPPSPDDSPNILVGTNPGPIQLPRGLANRDLVVLNGNGTSTTQRAITPFGYTVQMAAFLDYDGTGLLVPPGATNRNTGVAPGQTSIVPVGNVVKAYREFEVAFGVPIDMSMQVVESDIDLGKLGHSFGVQNGLMGYNGADPATFAPGFLPPPLYNLAAIGTGQAAPYDQFFKKFTVQNTGNVNFWNLRASQRREVLNVPNAIAGSGNTFTYFALRSNTVDPRFGILAVAADPATSLLGQNNLAPIVVTSLDRQFDGAWDALIQTDPLYTTPLPTGSSPYQLYYQQLAGRHTLHKPRVGVASVATLGVPDLPGSQVLRPVGDPQPTSIETFVGVAVPLGTPVGEYTSKLLNNPLVVFEDHDTNVGFEPTPRVLSDGTITPAGPFYNGSQVLHPGANPILSAGPGTGEGIWRARRIVNQNGRAIPEYQPATVPGIALKLSVTESPLTGDVADRAVAAGSIAASIASGRLPGVDFFPLIDSASGTDLRAAAALSPAAYRGPDGSVHVFFNRNANTATAQGLAGPGQPYRLFHSHLQWNSLIGAFTADTFGAPLDNSAANATALNNAGKWFTTPQLLAPGIAANESNISPFVLQRPGQTDATLFWVNSVPSQAGQPLNQIFFTRLEPNGRPATTGIPLFNNPDSSILRYSPRAIYEPITSNTIVFYHGGSAGRWGLYYVARNATAAGTPIGALDATGTTGGTIEVPLQLPDAISTATDPTPVLRPQVNILQDNGAVTPQEVVDVYYTGVSRATQSPDVYMSRFRLITRGGRVFLTPQRLPRVFRERLTKPGRDPIYQSRHIGWEGRVRQSTVDNLPTIYVGPNANVAVPVTQPNGWQRDEATGTLYQSYGNGANETIVYVDAAAGTVRFRGRGAPTGSQFVFADYQPTTYRITTDGVSNVAPFGFTDDRPLPATTALQPTNVVVRRANPMIAGRHWLFWKKGAAGNRPATLYYTARRVGIDLKAPDTLGTPLGQNDTIQLSPRDGNGNQLPLVQSVAVAGVGAVPFEVDYINGRIYVEPQHEGLAVTVQYIPTSNQTAGGTGAAVAAQGFLTYLDELAPTGSGTSGIQVPLNRSVNEGQVYAFLDTVAAPVGNRANPNPGIDPTLQPGKVWMFWSSPRGRVGSQLLGNGQATLDPFPGGFDLYWQTIAPILDPLTSTTPQ